MGCKATFLEQQPLSLRLVSRQENAHARGRMVSIKDGRYCAEWHLMPSFLTHAESSVPRQNDIIRYLKSGSLKRTNNKTRTPPHKQSILPRTSTTKTENTLQVSKSFIRDSGHTGERRFYKDGKRYMQRHQIRLKDELPIDV